MGDGEDKSVRCELYLNPGRTCTQHKIIELKDKRRMAWYGGIIAIGWQAASSGMIQNLSTIYSQNPWGLGVVIVIIVAMLAGGVKAAVAAEETNVLKYLILGGILPFAAFDGIVGPAFRMAPIFLSQ